VPTDGGSVRRLDVERVLEGPLLSDVLASQRVPLLARLSSRRGQVRSGVAFREGQIGVVW